MWHLGGLESASNPKANSFTLKALDCLNHLPKKRNDWEMTIWDGRGELGFEFRLNLNLWTNPSWTKLELKWPTQCCSAQTPGEIVWFFLQKHLHWKLRLALMQFLPFLFEKTKGIWKTAHPCITCTEAYHIFYQQATGRNVLLPQTSREPQPHQPHQLHQVTRLQLVSGSLQARVDQRATLTRESTGLNDVRKCHFLHRLLGKQIQRLWCLTKCIVNTYLLCLLINLNKNTIQNSFVASSDSGSCCQGFIATASQLYGPGPQTTIEVDNLPNRRFAAKQEYKKIERSHI